jgi:hypothetical protein
MSEAKELLVVRVADAPPNGVVTPCAARAIYSAMK